MQNRLTIGERYHFLVVVILQQVNRALIQKPHYTISRTYTKSCSRIKSFLFIFSPIRSVSFIQLDEFIQGSSNSQVTKIQ